MGLRNFTTGNNMPGGNNTLSVCDRQLFIVPDNEWNIIQKYIQTDAILIPQSVFNTQFSPAEQRHIRRVDLRRYNECEEGPYVHIETILKKSDDAAENVLAMPTI